MLPDNVKVCMLQVVSTNVGTAMIEALVQASDKGVNGKVKGMIYDAWQKRKHEYKRPSHRYNLSFKTAQRLKADGILV